MYRLSFLTILLLVLLRLAIGWHFLVEGANKVTSIYLVGETATSRPFSSAGYFREASGPLAPVFRQVIGDPDQEALALLTPAPRPGDAEPATDKSGQRIPPALREQWDAYVKTFESHYQLTPEQHTAVETKVAQARNNVVNWLEQDVVTTSSKEIKRTYPTGEVKIQVPTAARIREYRDKLAEIADMRHANWLFGKDVEGVKLRKVKAEAAEIRTELLKDLDSKTAEMKKSLDNVLTEEQKERGPVPAPAPNRAQFWLDRVTAGALTAIGACLLLGLLSRLNATLAGTFLLTTYLLVPALPWLPTPPNNEGNYLFVNKNFVEMLALFVLATLPTGRWFGLDALIHWMWRATFGHKPVEKQQLAHAA